MDRGMAMPDGEPPLLKERRHAPQEDAETIWRNLKSMGWKSTEPLWGAQDLDECAHQEQTRSSTDTLRRRGDEGLRRSREEGENGFIDDLKFAEI